MNVIKKTRPVCNNTPDDRIVQRVLAIDLEVKKEYFRSCFMSQNRVVAENKSVLPVLVPSLGIRLLLLLLLGNA